MKELLKKILPRILLIGIIIFLSNFVYIYTTYEKDLSANANVLSNFNKAVDKADVLYFSASPNKAFHQEDSDKRFISTIVDDSLTDLKVMSVDTGAIHAGVFKKLIKMIPDDSNIKYVVVHMNYRSFGQGWIQSKLENSIQKEMVFYNNRPPIVNRFLQGLNWYDAIPEAERKQMMLHSWETDPLPLDPPKASVTSWTAVEKWGDWTNPKRQLADHYIKNFAFTLNEENPRVQDFDEIVEICNKKGIKLIYVILPENLEEGEQLVDSDLINLMMDNKNWLMNRYSAKGVTMVDQFNTVSDCDFIERIFPSEHYRETGRQIIAAGIISAIKKLEGSN